MRIQPHCFFQKPFASALLLLAAFVTGSHAQDLDNATISGRVLDQTGALIPNANVTVKLQANGIERRLHSDEEGRYRFIQLEPGTYELRADAAGFATQTLGNISAIAGQNIRLDVTLYPADIVSNPVTVNAADAPPVDTTRTIVGGTVTRAEVETLPVATRSPLDLIFTLGGVTEEPLSSRDLAEDRNQNPRATPEEAGIFSLAGGAASSNNITIDGLDNNDDRAARERFQPSIEAVDEVQIIRNQFSAEYGRASGGRVNLRTRSGANRFRGRLFYFFRDESLNANSFYNNLRGLKRLPLQEHNPGFTLSGALYLPRFGENRSALIKERNRTFFFVAYEYDTLLDTALVDTLVPVERNDSFPLPPPTTLDARRLETVSAPSLRAEVAPFVETISTPQRNHIFTARIDHKYTQAHNASFLLQLGRLKNLRQFGGGLRLAESLQGRTRNTDALAYSDNYVLSPNIVNQLRFQLSRLSPAFEARNNSSPVVLISINDPLPSDNPANRDGTLVVGSSTTGASDRREHRFQIQDVFSSQHGAHSLKFGADVQRIRSTFIDLADASGTFNFDSAGDFLANLPSRFRQNFQTESTQRNTYTGFFAQDEWRVRSNLTVSYGVRYENETIIRDKNNFAPRFALAYDPLRSGKTVIRLGAGIFYNRALLRTIDDFTLGQQRLFVDTDTALDPATGKRLTPAQQSFLATQRNSNATQQQLRSFVVSNLNFPQTLNADSPLVAWLGGLQTSFSRRLDPALRIPESYQANIGFEREVGKAFVLEANYTFNRGIHLFREFNANAPVLPRGFKTFTDYLLSRDFPNFRSNDLPRPLYNTTGSTAPAGELVRFVLGASNTSDANNINRIFDAGVPVSVINLNSVNSTLALNAALGAIDNLRPDPTRAEVEQLASIGNSFYHGLTIEARRRFNRNEGGFGYSYRAAYTYSRLRDDGIVNTSDALVPGDFRNERARSLLDRRHRFVLSGLLDTPRYLGKLRFSTILRAASGAPFNISIGGVDRNLDDVGNDRPVFTGNARLLRARRPGAPIDPTILNAFALPVIGQAGNLPRNAASGPTLFLFDLNVTREFRVRDKVRLRPVVEFDNVLNKTVFGFGTQFIDFNAFSPTASEETRQRFVDNFLVATRTLRPRMIRVGLRFDF
ncbi:MAG: TonB-dependent receptor domain-containing protein [Pyrinomonadaceae bacterium]